MSTSFDTGSKITKGILIELIKLLRLTSKVPKLIPAIQFCVLMLYFYEFYNTKVFKEWFSKHVLEPIKEYKESCKQDYECYDKRTCEY